MTQPQPTHRTRDHTRTQQTSQTPPRMHPPQARLPTTTSTSNKAKADPFRTLPNHPNPTKRSRVLRRSHYSPARPRQDIITSHWAFLSLPNPTETKPIPPHFVEIIPSMAWKSCQETRLDLTGLILALKHACHERQRQWASSSAATIQKDRPN